MKLGTLLIMPIYNPKSLSCVFLGYMDNNHIHLHKGNHDEISQHIGSTSPTKWKQRNMNILFICLLFIFLDEIYLANYIMLMRGNQCN